jgi:hypothetical protein
LKLTHPTEYVQGRCYRFLDLIDVLKAGLGTPASVRSGTMEQTDTEDCSLQRVLADALPRTRPRTASSSVLDEIQDTDTLTMKGTMRVTCPVKARTIPLLVRRRHRRAVTTETGALRTLILVSTCLDILGRYVLYKC